MPLFGLFKVHHGIGGNNHQVPYTHFVGRGSVYANHAATSLSLDGVGADAFSIGDIVYVNFFVLNNVAGFHQSLVNSDAADIVKVGLGNCNSMYFRF